MLLRVSAMSSPLSRCIASVESRVYCVYSARTPKQRYNFLAWPHAHQQPFVGIGAMPAICLCATSTHASTMQFRQRINRSVRTSSCDSYVLGPQLPFSLTVSAIVRQITAAHRHGPSSAEHLLRCVRHVQKPVEGAMLRVDLCDRATQRDHRLIVDEQKDGLGGAESQPVTHDGAELRHGQLLRCEEFALVQVRQIDFLVVALDDDLRQKVRMIFINWYYEEWYNLGCRAIGVDGYFVSINSFETYYTISVFLYLSLRMMNFAIE